MRALLAAPKTPATLLVVLGASYALAYVWAGYAPPTWFEVLGCGYVVVTALLLGAATVVVAESLRS